MMRAMFKTVFAATLMVGSNAKAAVELGDTVLCSATSSISCSAPSALVAPSAEFNLVYFLGSNWFEADFGGNSLSINFLLGSAVIGPSMLVNFADLTNPITSFSLVSTNGVTGVGASNITLSRGQLGVQLGNGTTYSPGASIVLALGDRAVPEPATWAMMIAGFGMVGGAMRRRSAKARCCQSNGLMRTRLHTMQIGL